MATAFANNPFKPGAGRTPAHMGRRPEVENVLSGFLQTLAGDRPDLELGFLYGPRGNGKTVLLRWLHAEASAANITTVALVPQNLDSSADLTEEVRTATQRFARLWQWLSPFRAEFHGLKFGVTGAGDMPPLARVLNRGKDGVLLTLDEAHEAPPDMLGRFLNAMQMASENRPVAVVFAGTPGLEAALRAARASFWSRGRKLRVGLLSETSAAEALARPFRDAGIETDERAITELARAADCYPYFLQLYGEAAWKVVEASDGRTFLPEHVAPTLVAAGQERHLYYLDRYNEFDAAGLLPLARRVAEAFIRSAAVPADRRLSNETLNGLVAGEDGEDAKAFLIARGYVWQDDSARPVWMPGIPSLMDYMLESISAT